MDTEEDKAFIKEHGRLFRPIEHNAFDPFRRKRIKVPIWIPYLQTLIALVLIPLRLAASFIGILISYVIIKVFGPPITKESLASFEPAVLPSWRRQIVTHTTYVLARILLFSLGFWRINGKEHPDYNDEEARKATIISNHATLPDPCVLAFLFAPSFVAKATVNQIPGIGTIGAAQNALYINRVDGSGVSVTEKIAERQKLVAKGGDIPPVALFPEGTTTNGEYILKFRTGAFVAGMPIAPVLFRYEGMFFSPAYETIRTGKYIYGLLTQFASSVEYFKLPVYYPSEEEKKDARLYADNVHTMMLEKSEEAFGKRLVSSNSNYIDKMEYHSLVRGTKLKKGLQLNMDA